MLLNRGDCYRERKQVVEALTDYRAAKELSSHDVELSWAIQTRMAIVHNERGTRLFNHAEVRRAAVEFSRAIECNPKVAQFYTNRAQATMLLSRYDLVKDDVLAALSLNPHDEKAAEMLASLSPG